MNREEITYGTWIQIDSPTVVETIAPVGFDWVAFDLEHGEIGYNSLPGLFRPLEARGVAPYVRVRRNSTLDIRQALDLGAKGVIVPLVNTAEEARAAVSAALYPPLGIRGFAYCRCNGYGVDFDEYVKSANHEISVYVMVESSASVDNVESILATENLKGVLIGPYDLSGSYGVPGEVDCDIMRKAFGRIVSAARVAGKHAGIHVVTPDPKLIEAAIHDGFTFIALGMDDIFLRAKAKEALDTGRSLEHLRSA